jgi:hypothetical protein
LRTLAALQQLTASEAICFKIMDEASLPFLSRKQLSFQENTSFGIQIRSVGAQAAPLSIKGFTKEGAFNFLHTCNSNRTAKVETFNLPDAPIMLTVDDPTESAAQGGCYVRVSLVLNGIPVYQLGSGFIFGFEGINWPSVQLEKAEPTKSLVFFKTSADPAAGVELSYTVISGEFLKIRALRFTLVAAAAAASRRVHIVFTIGGTKCLDCFGATDQIISETKTYSCYPGANTAAATDDNDILIPIPQEIILGPTDTITTETTNLNAGDNFGVMTILCERFLTQNI